MWSFFLYDNIVNERIMFKERIWTIWIIWITYEFYKIDIKLLFHSQIQLAWLSNKMMVTKYVPGQIPVHLLNLIIKDILINFRLEGIFFPVADFYVTAGFIAGFPVDFPNSSAHAWIHRYPDFLKQFRS